MGYEAYWNVYIAALAVGIVMLAVTAALFFIFKIPRIIGELSGSAAKRAIENIKRENEQTEGRPAGGKAGGKHGRAGRKREEAGKSAGGSGRESLQPGPVTQKLRAGAETELLTEQITAAVSGPACFGAPPDAAVSGVIGFEPPAARDMQFEIEYDITYVHTQEMIPEE